VLVVKSQIKEVAQGFNISGDFAEALDQRVIELVKAAIQRADANGRRTVMAKDI